MRRCTDDTLLGWTKAGGESMALFVDILTKVTLPIITLVALGWLLQPKLKLDVPSSIACRCMW